MEGYWVLTIIPPMYGAILVVISICVVFYLLIPWGWLLRWTTKKVSIKLVRFIPILLICILGIILWVLWGGFIVRSLEGEVSVNNEYVKITTNPIYRTGNYTYALLVEFGVRRYGIPFNLTINTGTDYQYAEYWQGEPDKTDKSPKPRNLGVPIIVSSGGQVNKTEEPPMYKYSTNNLVDADNSYYFYFESYTPFEVKSISVNGRPYRNRGEGLWLPN